MHDNMNHKDGLNQATQTRLASVPVDITNLERRLNSLIADEAPERNRWRFSKIMRPLTALAATIVFMAAVGILMMSFGNTPVVAASTDMARLFTEATKADSMATSANSVEHASRILAGQWSDLPKLPTLASAQLHACCIHDFMDQKVACLILRDGETPLTMVVGHSKKSIPQKGVSSSEADSNSHFTKSMACTWP